MFLVGTSFLAPSSSTKHTMTNTRDDCDDDDDADDDADYDDIDCEPSSVPEQCLHF